MTIQRGSNLSQEDRERGGRASAAKQVRDFRGQFAGRKDQLTFANRAELKVKEQDPASRKPEERGRKDSTLPLF